MFAGSNSRLFVLFCFYVLFLVIGASIFSAIEGPLEVRRIKDLRARRAEFLNTYSKSFSCGMTDDDLESFISDIVTAASQGVRATRNVTYEPNWSFGQSLFFSSTVITTIGYGHIAPLSDGGKIFCIVYSLVGIPMTLILLTAFVERLLIPTTFVLGVLNSRLGHLYQPFNIRILHLCLLAAVLLLVFFTIPAIIFANLEDDWTFLDALYYCFISLTTIGLGDFVPGDQPHQQYRTAYKIVSSAYLLVGLTSMMLMLTVFYDIPQLNFGLFFLLKSDEYTSDPEKMRLHGTVAAAGPKYTPQVDEPVRENIRVKARAEADSSPEEGRN